MNERLKDFALIRNRVRPELCYSYELKKGSLKHTIFTMNGGIDYLATIEEKMRDKKYYKELQGTYSSIDECLDVFDKYDNK